MFCSGIVLYTIDYSICFLCLYFYYPRSIVCIALPYIYFYSTPHYLYSLPLVCFVPHSYFMDINARNCIYFHEVYTSYDLVHVATLENLLQ